MRPLRNNGGFKQGKLVCYLFILVSYGQKQEKRYLIPNANVADFCDIIFQI